MHNFDINYFCFSKSKDQKYTLKITFTFNGKIR